MSHRGISSLTKLPQEDTWVPEKLSASRWAPGGMEDQRMDISKFSKDDMPTPATDGLASSHWAPDPAEPSQTGNKKTARPDQKNNKKYPGMKAQKSTVNQPSPNFNNNNNHRETPIITAPSTARRIIGPLSAEEEEVKMENPFFDPAKHKGLGSSRWAN